MALPLTCPPHHNEWGRPARYSEVAQLLQATGTQQVEDGKPYAELWMGTHPSGEATIEGTKQTLREWLEANPQALGEAVLQKFGKQLPFLFKVLSVGKVLPLQIHPDKKLAEQLHDSDAETYSDDNHKPEMALALEHFEALAGFVPPNELRRAVQGTQELHQLLAQEAVQSIMDAGDDQKRLQPHLKAAFTALMTTDATKAGAAVSALVRRLHQQEGEGRPLGPKDALALRLHEQHPGDVGVLAAYFLNLVRLEPCQAIALGANEIHAYISGQLMELMATSDNVINAAFTNSDPKDPALLAQKVAYTMCAPEVITGTPINEHIQVFRPPFESFEIQHIQVPAGQKLEADGSPSPMLLLVQHGHGSAEANSTMEDPLLQANVELHRGKVLFLPANTHMTYQAAEQQPMTIWAASVNAKAFAATPRTANGAT